MRSRLVSFLLVAALVAAACAPSAPPPASAPPPPPRARARTEAAELVLAGGPVLRTGATALALRGGRIVGVGDAASLAPFRGPRTRWVDLGGRSVVVALTDAHVHLVGVGLQLEQADVRGCAAADECANRSALDAFERAGCRRGRDARFRIEHAQIVDRADLPRFAALGVLASMQPTHATSDMPWAATRLGPQRLAGAYAWRSLLASGARLPAGSDAPVEPLDPAFGLYAFVTRQDAAGRPPGGWLPAERLRLDEAVRAFTEKAAFAAFEERWRGRAAAGMAADVTVFDRGLDEREPASIHDAQAQMTIVGGRVVFER